MCAAECKLVPPDQAIGCQQNCIKEYCSHKCADSSEPPVKSGCNSCLDQQFNLCESVCESGTDRVVALCKLDCANARCAAECAAPKSANSVTRP